MAFSIIAEWSTRIGPDPSRSCALIGGTLLSYVGAKVYAITTHLKASKIVCLSRCCYGIISGPYAIKTQQNAPVCLMYMIVSSWHKSTSDSQSSIVLHSTHHGKTNEPWLWLWLNPEKVIQSDVMSRAIKYHGEHCLICHVIIISLQCQWCSLITTGSKTCWGQAILPYCLLPSKVFLTLHFELHFSSKINKKFEHAKN